MLDTKGDGYLVANLMNVRDMEALRSRHKAEIATSLAEHEELMATLAAYKLRSEALRMRQVGEFLAMAQRFDRDRQLLAGGASDLSSQGFLDLTQDPSEWWKEVQKSATGFTESGVEMMNLEESIEVAKLGDSARDLLDAHLRTTRDLVEGADRPIGTSPIILAMNTQDSAMRTSPIERAPSHFGESASGSADVDDVRPPKWLMRPIADAEEDEESEDSPDWEGTGEALEAMEEESELV